MRKHFPYNPFIKMYKKMFSNIPQKAWNFLECTMAGHGRSRCSIRRMKSH